MTPLISEFLFDLLTALSASQVYPRILEWATYPITTLLDRVWTVHVKRNLLNPQENGRPDPVYVELISVAERCLNFAHTGAAKVLNRNLMWHMWVTRGILDNGFPSFWPGLIISGEARTTLHVELSKWPLAAHPAHMPLLASRRSQELTYGLPHFLVCTPMHDLTMMCDAALHRVLSGPSGDECC